VPYGKPRSHAINHKVTGLSTWMSSSVHDVLTSIVEELCYPLSSSSTTLSLPDTNVWHQWATCCLDIASLLYTSMSCGWILAANTAHAHKKHVTPWTSNQDQFSKWVTMWNCYSCPPSAPMPSITWPWTLELSVAYTNSILNVNELGILNNRMCKAATLVDYKETVK
jgi:hypothetical protein